MKISYNWLKWYIPEIPEASKLEDIFTYHLCEVEGIENRIDGDVIFDLNILPNRAHDLLSHAGVAKELSGLLGISFQDPTPMYVVPQSEPTKLTVSLETSSCRRYSARIVRNVRVTESPEWVVKHLESIGEKSINNIVDATNLVMFNSGNPAHAFDLKKSGDHIRIIEAKEVTEFEALGSEGKKITLKETDVVIASGEDSVLALAGVKGGVHSGIDSNTNDIILEVANFDPSSVRKTARRIGILSDAAKRFENNVSPEHTVYAMRELSALIKEMCPEAVFEDVVDVYPNKQELKTFSFEVGFISKRLGLEVSAEQVEVILKNYGYVYERKGDTFTITPPYLRLDLEIPEDLIEEIGRVIGYDKVVPELPKSVGEVNHSEEFLKIQKLREYLLAEGYHEVKTYAFRKKGEVEVARGVGDKSALRKNLTDGIKESFELNRLNAGLLGIDSKALKIFEIAAVFPSIDGEKTHVCIADKNGTKEITLIEALDVYNITDFSLIPKLPVDSKVFTMWSLYPYSSRDIACWAPPESSIDSLFKEIKKISGNLLARDPWIFDSFEKEGKKSYAFRLVFQAQDKTLTDEDIDPIIIKIQEFLVDNGYTIR